VAQAALCTGIHLLAIFLVLEDDGDVLGGGLELWVRDDQDSARCGSESEAAESDSFSAAWKGALRGFTRTHGEEESP
jgi:hypothetical protein